MPATPFRLQARLRTEAARAESARAPMPRLLLALALGCASGGGPGTRPAAPTRPEASRAYDARFPDPGTPLEVRVLSTSDRSGRAWWS